MDIRQHRLMRDPFGSGLMRPVRVMQLPPPEGWSLSRTTEGEPVYVSADCSELVQLLEMRDSEGRAWRHAFVMLPRPVDLARARFLAWFFLGDARLWFDPCESPVDSPYAMVRFHHCVTRDEDGPPAPWRRHTRRQSRRRAPSQIVSLLPG